MPTYSCSVCRTALPVEPVKRTDSEETYRCRKCGCKNTLVKNSEGINVWFVDSGTGNAGWRWMLFAIGLLTMVGGIASASPVGLLFAVTGGGTAAYFYDKARESEQRSAYLARLSRKR